MIKWLTNKDVLEVAYTAIITTTGCKQINTWTQRIQGKHQGSGFNLNYIIYMKIAQVHGHGTSSMWKFYTFCFLDIQKENLPIYMWYMILGTVEKHT